MVHGNNRILRPSLPFHSGAYLNAGQIVSKGKSGMQRSTGSGRGCRLIRTSTKPRNARCPHVQILSPLLKSIRCSRIPCGDRYDITGKDAQLSRMMIFPQIILVLPNLMNSPGCDLRGDGVAHRAWRIELRQKEKG